MKTIALLLFAVTASAAPQITRITPAQGFSFYGARVEILGTELSPETKRCYEECGNGQQLPCPVSVFFGTQEGFVLDVSPERIFVFAPAHAEGAVDVIVRVPGRADVVVDDGFTYSKYATVGPDSYRRYLVPLTTIERPGANGSRWVTELLASNLELDPLTVVAPGDDRTLESTETSTLDVEPRSVAVDGAFLYVPNVFVYGVPMTLRSRDTSRSSENLGTEIPLVGEDEFATRKHILDIPTDARYRATLRVYSDSAISQAARLRVYSMATGVLLDDRAISLTGQDQEIAALFPLHPAYAQIDPLTAAVRGAAERVRLEVSADTPVWAMVSVTNNETQQVTTITPHRP
ncbi:MAG TPA: IPT/TIG domain-containing protein [Thermoanaerobaculia bacterium]|nr:IPT/TIG domain-containing protein [Thermoanaerobaculia bacterium]